MMARRRLMLVVAFVLVMAAVPADVAHAQHDDYRYKWPWLSTTSVVVTGYPFTAHHTCADTDVPPDGVANGSCTNAFDFVVSSDLIHSSAEGAVTIAVENLSGCLNSGGAGGLGNYVQVSVPSASPTIYAHLQQNTVAPSVSSTIYQGDLIGNQGDTGNTENGSGGCGEHLHFEWTGTRPAKVDGQATNLNPISPVSTNSPIGDYSAAGAAIRQYYTSHGGWAAMGWTQSLAFGNGVFPIHIWGWGQDFRRHPDGFGGDDTTITVGKWNQNAAYLIDLQFWPDWAAGGRNGQGQLVPISLPLGARGPCPAGSAAGCVTSQRFHLGYIWANAFGIEAVFCPATNSTNSVGLADALQVLSAFGTADPWLEVNGFGENTLADTLAVLGVFGRSCLPGRRN